MSANHVYSSQYKEFLLESVQAKLHRQRVIAHINLHTAAKTKKAVGRATVGAVIFMATVVLSFVLLCFTKDPMDFVLLELIGFFVFLATTFAGDYEVFFALKDAEKLSPTV